MGSGQNLMKGEKIDNTEIGQDAASKGKFSELESENLVSHARAVVKEVTGNDTLTNADSGKVIRVTADAVITLPATLIGLTFLIENSAGSAISLAISPDAADLIKGGGISSPTDDKDLINTQATAKKGDMVALFGDGDAGWTVQNIGGVWELEA